MKLKITSAVAALATFFLVTGAQAAPITGQITLSADSSSVAINFAANTVTFAPSSPALNAKVDTVNGNMTGLAPVGTLLTYKNFQYDPLVVINPIWLTTTGLSFTLTSISSVTENVAFGGLLLFGSGIISSTNPAFDPTPGNWSFNASESDNATFSWGSTASVAPSRVPDGGASAILLGVSLLGLVGASRKFRKI